MTPWSFRVHYYANTVVEICPHDAHMVVHASPFMIANASPFMIANWLITEGWYLVFEPNYKPLEVEL
jgi:hypothetical protein